MGISNKMPNFIWAVHLDWKPVDDKKFESFDDVMNHWKFLNIKNSYVTLEVCKN